MTENTKKILLVEDDSAIIDIYKIIMERAHFEVEVLSLGQEVIKKIKNIESGQEVKPDIILLDLILPDINGIEVLREVRKSSATKDTKVFILTNQESSQVIELENIKPDMFIVKANITPTQLLELIKKELN
ncbi:MAG: Response regulator [Parcubacteria group bacterium GW2011_GWA1_33_6]|uniref:Response regulatory domain-containing protein n=1 Tax=Candidatus Staskawiczbacteria bacterium RIFCSPHIGHO2_02_FULL_33_16 TaxID=1802204 RepID=A0A1G2HVA0_9BACT|nr:MAG: Response regulator [Parcubacteria group bacterium GW2011_GWA2_33_14]KKP54782.1 MAG: Response regulator [Parcubacteria group bacterium GW2011_GWA1_33_6]OGZ66385.1 MAG: hypothetical protein A3D34_02845 [Candidatus Staskawiczbacteria bacterium RIFCSPHIGHO2_02_FULL_33_16]OGZ70527.1 MAG: hypothetical protein A2980_01085 [Candidatus Staskawiczbacteria bacterium RIFCSPLOWO2_01_FULL_33_13]